LEIRSKDGEKLYCMKFSRDAKYLAYGGRGRDEIITLWIVKDIAAELPVNAISLYLMFKVTG